MVLIIFGGPARKRTEGHKVRERNKVRNSIGCVSNAPTPDAYIAVYANSHERLGVIAIDTSGKVR